MSVEDDESSLAALANAGHNTDEEAEDAVEDEMPDFRDFSRITGKKSLSSSAIRKGEKDFEATGTRAQQDALEQSRSVMEEILSYTRTHAADDWMRGWYFPDALVDIGADDESPEWLRVSGERPVNARNRVVVVEVARRNVEKHTGMHVPAIKHECGNRLWLLPEEALFLVERGSLDLWWPTRSLAEILPRVFQGNGGMAGAETSDKPPSVLTAELDDYEAGFPLSLQAAYSLLIGYEGERGKISLPKYQVYSNLRRGGMNVLRAATIPPPLGAATASEMPASPPSIWAWLFSLVFSSKPSTCRAPPPIGPLVQPGLYRSYRPIYEMLHLIPRHKPLSDRQQERLLESASLPVTFHVWKPSSTWRKRTPPAPDFLVAVADAHASTALTLDEVGALLAAAPWQPPAGRMADANPGRLYGRLKHGYRSVLVAVVDHGIINYARIAEGGFGEETLWERFDATLPMKPKGAGQGGNKKWTRVKNGKQGKR
jgi:tRNA-splicing endonuclease subunit Sen54